MARTMIAVFGRRNVVRLARLLQNEARLDVPNDMATNGELLVQRCVLNIASARQAFAIADVGANIGEWTSALLSQVPSSHIGTLSIHAFEPDRNAAELFRANLPPRVDDVSIELNQFGLSSRSGIEALYLVGPAAGTNSLHAPPDATTNFPTDQVRLTTLDEYAAERGIERFLLVKVDTEGHDLRVIQGAQRLLRKGSIDVIQFEYNHRWIDSRCFLRDVFELMRPIGYRIGKVTPKGIEFYEAWHPELETYREGNYVACRPEWVSAFKTVIWWNGR